MVADENPAERYPAEHSIDWSAIKHRLESVARAMDDAAELTVDQARRAMDRRAERLAQVPASQLEESEVIEVVQFRIAGERCAIETRFVGEVMRREHVTAIPAVPAVFVGVTNLRGQILIVITLEPWLGLGTSVAVASQLLVLGEDAPEMAIMVDQIDQVVRLRREQVLPLSGGMSNLQEIACGCTAEGRVILSGEALLRCDAFTIEESE
ncbi:chemotaxis protein CheW [Roseimaritima sediminicola]|uniref:chemotaxis protein CheW n=1 Tax=Roseimaritima sediminicola TaxID=2662066 RepID=UPI00129842E8|nr:chemotaxis protein CheW [Roseimaritima sediminicola]